MYYSIRETLEPVAEPVIGEDDAQYVSLLSYSAWRAQKEQFDLGMDIEEPEKAEIFTTHAQVNYDSLTGTFCIPNRKDFDAEDVKFSFALDEKGIIFIDDTGAAEAIVETIRNTRRWRAPSLERFLYDFLEQIVKDDLALMTRLELEMDTIFRRSQYIDEGDIRAMKKLKRLVLNGGYELGNLGVLRECKSLENLEIAFCEFRPLDLSVLNGLPIKELKLTSCLVHDVKGLENCPLKKISIDFCPIASLDDFGLFPNVRIVELRRTGIRSADRDAVLRHFPRIWSLLYGDLIEGFCDGDRCNEVVCFGPTNIVFAAGGDKSKGLSFMGFDMDSSIVYDKELCSLCEVIGMSDCVWVSHCEIAVGLGRPFHGFTTVKLIGCGEVERIGDGTYDGPVDSLEFLREDDGVVFDFPSEKKWAVEIAAEMERVYGATFCWDDNDETATFLVVKGKSDAFDFVISSCAGSSETHCGTGDEVSITRREYRGRQFYVSRRGSAESAP